MDTKCNDQTSYSTPMLYFFINTGKNNEEKNPCASFSWVFYSVMVVVFVKNEYMCVKRTSFSGIEQIRNFGFRTAIIPLTINRVCKINFLIGFRAKLSLLIGWNATQIDDMYQLLTKFVIRVSPTQRKPPSLS